MVQRLVEVVSTLSQAVDTEQDLPLDPARVLAAILRLKPDGSPETLDVPLTPLLDTTLLTNSRGEPAVGRELRVEIHSSDSVDVVMAFVRWSGIHPMMDVLRRHCEAGKKLRIVTTTYTNSTELRALDELKALGAEVKVSYDTASTRLHAKAWLFHRQSGYSTAYIGSSNLTHSAMVTGLEWNVRISGVRNPDVVAKMNAVFESYWASGDFITFDHDEFLERTKTTEREDTILLSPIEIVLRPFQERLLEQVELARTAEHHRNLLVSATGTGKTVMAAVDYARLANPFAETPAAVRCAPPRDSRAEPRHVRVRACGMRASASFGSEGSDHLDSSTSSLQSRASTAPDSNRSTRRTSTL